MPDHRPLFIAERGKLDGAHADALMGALAAGQHGVVTRRQLLAAGLTPALIDRRLASGHLLTLHRGVYAVGHRELRREGRWLAAVLAVRDGAALSHTHAAALHGIAEAHAIRIDVTTPGRATRRPGIRIHARRQLDPADVTSMQGIPTTTLPRTLVDLAEILTPEHLTRALNEADRLHPLDAHAVHEALARTTGRHGPGHAALRRALSDHQARGATILRSTLEARFLALVAKHRLPRPQTNAHIGRHEVDALWPEARLAVELDGWAYHHHRDAFERDRAKGNALSAAGFTVLRFTHDQVVRRPAEVAATLDHMLRARSAA